MKKIIAILLTVTVSAGVYLSEVQTSATDAQPMTTPIVEDIEPVATETLATEPVVEQETTPIEETKPADTTPVVEQETTPIEETKPATTEPVVEQESTPAATEPVAHSHNYTVMVTVATCTEDGYTTYTCECGDCYHEGIKASGHDYEIVITEATCTEDGCMTYTCANCGDSYTEITEQACGHEYLAEVVAPTEQDRGYTIHTCVHCGDSYVDSYTEPVFVEAQECVCFYDPNVVEIDGNAPTDMLLPGRYAVKFADGSFAILVVSDGYWWYEA